MKVIVTGGGTGGHIYPAVSIGQTLKKKFKQTDLVYVGRKNGLEAELVPKLGVRFIPVSITYRRAGVAGLVKYVGSLVTSVIQAFRIVIKEKPALVVGTGGYVSWPVMFAASLLGVPTAVHEANAKPGRANQFLSRMVDRVMISFEDKNADFSGDHKTVLTGNPVRDAFFNLDRKTCRADLGIDDDVFVLLSVGGSGGAKKVNETMIEVMKELSGDDRFLVIHGTGKAYYDTFMRSLKDRHIMFEKNIQVEPYLYNMPQLMAASDLMITRAGASTLSEIAVSSTPAILIPSPNVKDNHQEYNARTMEKQGAGIMVLEHELDAGRLVGMIEDLRDNREKGDHIRNACEKLPGRDASDRILSTLTDLLKEKGKLNGKSRA